MKKFIMIIFALAVVSFSINAYSKCMYGSDWKKGGKKIVVCTHGDSFSDRKKGRSICEKIKGSSCGSPSTFSSSCGNGECYDSSGKNHYSLSGY